MTSTTPGCCPPGSVPSSSKPMSDSKPMGKMITMNAAVPTKLKPIECYIVGTPLQETKRIVLVYTDVFGIDSGNHKVVADRLSESLCSTIPTTVLIPDFFRGKPIVTSNWCITAQVLWTCKFRVTDVALDTDIQEIIFPYLAAQTTQRISDIGVSCVGFCFGGWLTGRTLALANSISENDGNVGSTTNEKNNDTTPSSTSANESVLVLISKSIRCGVGIHPSFRIETIHGRVENDLAIGIGAKPILLLPAVNDTALLPNHENASIQTLAAGSNVDETDIAIPFPTMQHGWVTRGDCSDESVRQEQDRALQLSVEFIEKHHST